MTYNWSVLSPHFVHNQSKAAKNQSCIAADQQNTYIQVAVQVFRDLNLPASYNNKQKACGFMFQ